MTTPFPDEPPVTNARPGGEASTGVTPAEGARPTDEAEERAHAPRLFAWGLVFAAVVIGVALYLIYARRLSPLLD